MKKPSLIGVGAALAAFALTLGILTAPGCASRADWEAGLDQAQTISDTAGSEIGRVRQIMADLEHDLAQAEPGSEFAQRLRGELAKASEQLALVHQQKQVADQKIADYRDRLASVPEGAEPWEISAYMIGQGAQDISRIVPSPVGEILFGAGVLLAGVSSAGWRKATATATAEKKKKEHVIAGLEVAKRKNPDLAGAFHAAGGDIQIALGPDLAREVNSIRRGA